MASKLRLITDLYGETLTQISKNPDEWMSFLECAAESTVPTVDPSCLAADPSLAAAD